MLKIYNSLSKKVEDFKPYGDVVTMYSCGPTVYSYAHIGNMRAYLFMDEIRRVLKYNGYNINGVINITDVGHMVSDADTGVDKMEVASAREHKSPWEIAEYYTKFFMSQTQKLNIDMPEHIVKATDTIKEMIDFVSGLLDKGFAYITPNGVYFDIQKFTNYGMLSGTKLEDKLSGARIEVDTFKHHPADFVLWVKAPKEHIMQWDSPWGMGYPGWHIECSAMGRKFFGEHIDIHTGGVDHKTVHHENEIAQNDSLCGHQVVHYWMHTEFLQVDGGKMSKSLNNFYTIDDLEKRGYSALDFRYFSMNAHYSKPQNFTFEIMDSSKVSRVRLNELVLSHKNGTNKIDSNVIDTYENKFVNAINDDLNIPLTLGLLWEVVKNNPKSNDIYTLALKWDKIFGLDFANLKEEQNVDIPQNIVELAEQRKVAKQNKNYAKADELRGQVTALGYMITDTSSGYTITKI